MAESSEDDMQNCIKKANSLIKAFDMDFPRISSIEEVSCCLFVALFEHVTGHAVPDLFLTDDISTDVRLIQAIICRLEDETTGISLSHISGNAIVSGDVNAMLNLLEILEALFLQLSQLKNEKSKNQTSLCSSTDSVKLQTTSRSSSRVSTKSEESALVSSNKPSLISSVIDKKMLDTMRKSPHSKGVPDIVDNVKAPFNNKERPRTVKRLYTEKQNSIEMKKMLDTTRKSPYSKSVPAIVDNKKFPINKNMKIMSKTVKQPSSEILEELYNSNYQKKVRILLQSDISPSVRAQQLKKKYLQSSKPVKRTIAPCKKSFLLPTDLRPKSKPAVKQAQSQSGKNAVKTTISKGSSEIKSRTVQKYEKRRAFFTERHS